MSRAFCIPGLFFIFAAFVLNFLVSISLPFLPDLDIARTHLSNAEIRSSQGVTEIRFGIWAPCYYESQDRTCLDASHAYSVNITEGSTSQVAFIQSSWTRGLAVHPVAAIVTLVALVFALSTHLVMTLLASLFASLAATLTLIAFAIDIALFALVKHETDRFGAGVTTKTAPGFWMTFVALILLVLGACTVCLGRRRDSRNRSTPTNTNTRQNQPFLKRFGRKQGLKQ